MLRFARWYPLAAILLVLGCNSGRYSEPTLTPATIVVMLDDQPLPNAQITLSPSSDKLGANSVSTGVTDENGKVTLMCGGKPGACIGINRITVGEASPPEELRGEDAQAKASQYLKSLKNRPIPAKYETLAQSDLTVEIKKDQPEYALSLKR